MKTPCVYILASEKYGTLYIGIQPAQTCWEHQNSVAEGFRQRYGVSRLVWFEQHQTMDSAISREKAMKKWRRDWKLNAIEAMNPEWRDLYPDLV